MRGFSSSTLNEMITKTRAHVPTLKGYSGNSGKESIFFFLDFLKVCAFENVLCKSCRYLKYFCTTGNKNFKCDFLKRYFIL